MTAGISGSFPFFFFCFQMFSSRMTLEETQPVEGPVPAVSLQHHTMRQKAQVHHPKQTHDQLSSA